MSYCVVLSKRDRALFSDIRRFGFTTTVHYQTIFGTGFSQARKRFSKLVRSHYLKIMGTSSVSKRKFYVPDFMFFSVCPSKEICKMNLFTAEHDEYILTLYSLLKKAKWGEQIEIEQDFKKRGDHRRMERIPDLIVREKGGNFIFEYEKSVKNDSEYEQMRVAYEKLSPQKNYFVFICENQLVAKKIRSKMNFRYMAVIRPNALLEQLQGESTAKLAGCFEKPEVNYFPEGGVE